MFELGMVSTACFLVAGMMAGMGLAIFLGSKDPEARAFLIVVSSVVIWAVSHGFFHGTQDPSLAFILVRSNFFMGMVIATSFFYFTATFYREKQASFHVAFPLVIIVGMFAVLYLVPQANNPLISGVEHLDGPQGWAWSSGPIRYLFDLSFLAIFSAGILTLFLKYTKESNEKKKQRALLMFVAMLVGTVPTSLVNVILPDFFGYYALDWVGVLFNIGWVSVLAYSIVKYNQMNVRYVLAEVLVFAGMFLLFMAIFI